MRRRILELLLRGPNRMLPTLHLLLVVREVLIGELHEAVRLYRIDRRDRDRRFFEEFARRPAHTILPLLLGVLHKLRERFFLSEAASTALSVALQPPSDVVAIDDDALEFGARDIAHLGILVDDADQLDGIRHEGVLILQ